MHTFSFVLSALARVNLVCAAAGRSWGRLGWGWYNAGGAVRFSAPAHAQLPIPIRSSPCKSIPKHRGARIANSHRISSQSLSWDPAATNKGQLAVLKMYNFIPMGRSWDTSQPTEPGFAADTLPGHWTELLIGFLGLFSKCNNWFWVLSKRVLLLLGTLLWFSKEAEGVRFPGPLKVSA